MQKRVHVFVFVVGIFIALSFMSIASAATDSTVLDEVITEHPDEIITDGGLKPGDFFYFADEFFNQFQNEISVKEEYMAVIFEL